MVIIFIWPFSNCHWGAVYVTVLMIISIVRHSREWLLPRLYLWSLRTCYDWPLETSQTLLIQSRQFWENDQNSWNWPTRTCLKVSWGQMDGIEWEWCESMWEESVKWIELGEKSSQFKFSSKNNSWSEWFCPKSWVIWIFLLNWFINMWMEGVDVMVWAISEWMDVSADVGLLFSLVVSCPVVAFFGHWGCKRTWIWGRIGMLRRVWLWSTILLSVGCESFVTSQ